MGDQVMPFLHKECRPTTQQVGSMSIQSIQTKEINDNAYILDLPLSMGISYVFNMVDLTLYYPDSPLYTYSGTSSLQE